MSFERTGKRRPSNTISRDAAYLDANNGLLIPTPISGKSIVIYDVLVSSGSGKLGTAADGGGTRICNINTGNNHFNIPTIVPRDEAVYTDAQSGNITITYAIVRGLPASLITNVAGSGTTTTSPPVDPCEFHWWNSSQMVHPESQGTGSQMTLSITRTGNLTPTASVDYETYDITATGGTDYTTIPTTTLSFASGEASKNITIDMISDYALEGTEQYGVRLSSPTQTGGSATITVCSGCNTGLYMPNATDKIVDISEKHSEIVGFASGATSSTVTEGDSGTSIHNVEVVRGTFPTSIYADGTVTVDYATSDGVGAAGYNAVAGDDYEAESGTLSFGPGVTSIDIPITINGDTTVEENQLFTITLTNPQISGVAAGINVSIYPYATHSVSITNDDTTTTTTTTTTTAAPVSNVCVAEELGNESYWALNAVFTPVVGANAIVDGKTQYTNGPVVAGHGADDDGIGLVEAWIVHESGGNWAIYDAVNGENGVGSPYATSDDDADDPWDASWSGSYTMTETSSSTQQACANYPSNTPNVCVDASSYDEDGTYTPYQMWNNKPVWRLLDSSQSGYDLFLWYDSSMLNWNISSGAYGDAAMNGQGGTVYIMSDGDGTNPWDATWEYAISGCGSGAGACVTEGSC